MRTAQELNSLALRTRRMWNEDGYSPIDIFAIVNGWKEKKITIVRYPMSSRISGMCTKENEDILKELDEIDVSTLTPIDALNTIYRLQNRLRNRWGNS